MTMIIDGSGTIDHDGNTATMPSADGTMVVMQGTSQSMVRLNTANGYGSTNTKIRRFTNTVTNQGVDITYADSSTLGASFTINTAGVYAISYCDEFSGGAWMGISLNSSQLTTAIYSITLSDALVYTLAQATYGTACATTVYLAAGSIIRAHTDGTSTGSNQVPTSFTITRVA
jgi:hypothetical protein